MKKTKILALLLALTMLVMLFAGCAKTPANESTPTPTPTATIEVTPDDNTPAAPQGVTVIDMTGREITLDKPAERVVALTASDCEILYAIGAGNTLVGRGEYCDYPPEVFDVTSVQSGYDTNIEQIIALAPDVLLMSTMAQSEEQIAQLEGAGIKVVVSNAYDIAGTYTAIELIGKLMGKDAQAAAVIADMRAAFADLAAKAASATPINGDGKTIYFEVSSLTWGAPWAAGGGSFMDEIATLLGLTNIFGELSAWAEVSEEQVLARNPDYILTIDMYYGEGQTPVEEILARTGWESVTAVKNGAILNLPNNELSRPAPRLVDGARALYEFVYGAE
jgi:iron complex transport system substrate-binding protein